MKKILCFVLTFVILSGFCIMPLSADHTFDDVHESDWFAPAVMRIKELGYMNGTSNTAFSPYEGVSRAMAVRVLYNMSGEKEEYSSYFADVPKNAWFAEAVCWAKNKGITDGTSGTKFSPDLLITREQLACFIDRYINAYSISLPNETEEKYADTEKVSEWALEAVDRMAKHKIMTPRIHDFFYPEATVSRAEFAAFVLSLKGEGDISRDRSVHVQLIYADTASSILEKGQTLSIKGVLYPENVTDTKISYISSDPTVASIDGTGKITAISKGTAKITLTSRDGGFKAYSVITVNDKPSATSNDPYTDGIYNSSADNSEMKPLGNGRYIDPNKPMVALTYDDGPHRTYTNQILDTMEKYGAVATFFELGNRAENCGDIIRREVELGCEVGNHSYDHPNLANLSASGVYNQINKTNNIIYNACGVWPELVRPPYGSLSTTAKNNINAPAINWSIDTLDWKYRDASYVTSVIKSQVSDGSVILMHSLYGSTAKATEIIVPWLLSQGYQLVTVSELAEAKGIDLIDGKVYYSFR
ncbi:MAG: hypothetical protein E7652_06250 [Ruminococcaceae bacterium]|nr:hypothetical protein [Oscillospiraceae bacterium]